MKKNNVLRTNFELTKIKIKEELLEASYLQNIVDKDESWKAKHDIEVPMLPHPDMLNMMDDFKRMLAYQHGLTLLESVVNTTQFNASAAQKKFIDQAIEEMLTDVKVTGFSLSGENLDKVVITGSYEGLAINGRKFSVEEESLGFEEQAKDLILKISDEAFEFIFNGKRAQLDLFNEPAETEEKE